MRENVLADPHFKWYRRGMWSVSIFYAAWIILQSVPFYNYINAGEKAYMRGDYITAEQQLQSALRQSDRFDDNDPRRARALNNLAELYRTLGRYAEAEPLFKMTI